MKLTEKEFLDTLAARVAGTTDRHRQAEIARDILREAGLEFAPEPKLPECLTLNALGEVTVPLSLAGVRSLSFDEALATVNRYNVYSGLKEMAQRLADYLRKVDGTGSLVTEATQLLAKMPK